MVVLLLLLLFFVSLEGVGGSEGARWNQVKDQLSELACKGRIQ